MYNHTGHILVKLQVERELKAEGLPRKLTAGGVGEGYSLIAAIASTSTAPQTT